MKLRILLFIASCPIICCPNQTQIRQKENELARMESDTHYQRHFARSNFIRTGTAFTIALAGMFASVTAPKHLVDKKDHKPFKTFLSRLSVGTVILGYTAIGATMVNVTRPILWFKEYKRERLKKKILDLKLRTQNEKA